ncbi:tetratricopeptide repeat protein [uncultured Aquimarina sp.]|uniref:tetratricopeptide repeat protein n=1 Tax=uncultured Aquimarina sp. TaxID=575652 RepID=UPI0026237A57|nr:tetratricopeptide repeat protein [uncultured Aquimarina sp.]
MLLYRILLVFTIILFSCKENKSERVSDNLQNSSSENSVADSKQYKITKNCKDTTYTIDLDFKNESILIQKNDQQFQILASNLIEDVSNNEMVTDLNIICNCGSDHNEISINYEFDLIHYKSKSFQHRIVFKEEYVFITKAYHFYSDRQEESLFGKVFQDNISYSYNESVDFESDTTRIINFRNFQDQAYEQNIDLYSIAIEDLYKTREFDKLKLFGDSTVLEIALYNVAINKALVQYNDIAYYLEQGKAYKEAIFLLERIVKEAPNRTVAYINLGDAYWGIGEKEEAKKAYQTYVKQMKANGKASKIPKLVLKKIK